MKKFFTILLLMLGLLPGLTFGAPFTPGNIVVARIGDGVTALTTAASKISVLEFTSSGVLVQTIDLPVIWSGSNKPITTTGTSTSEGFLSLSPDGQYLNIAGYVAIPGTPTVTNTTQRVVAFIDMQGNIETKTIFSGVATTNIRSAVSNGNNVWVATSTSVFYNTKNADSTSTQTLIVTQNSRVLNIFNNQLYLTSASGAFNGINTVGTGLPITTATLTLQTFGGPTTKSNYGFTFSPDGKTFYLADDGAVASFGGLRKFTSTTSYTAPYNYNYTTRRWTSTTRGIVGDFTGSNPVLYAMRQDSLFKVTDNGDSNTTLTFLATAGTNYAFRGICFAPNSAVITSNTTLPAGTYNNITVNGGTATLAGNVTVSGTLTLNGGNIDVGTSLTDAPNILTIGTSGTNLGSISRTSGTIIGTLARWFNNVTVSNVLYPVGTATNYRPATISFPIAPTIAGTISISHTNGDDGSDLTIPIVDGAFTVNRRSNMFWTVENNGVGAASFDLSIDGNGQTGITNSTELRAIFSPDGGTTFLAPGVHAIGSGNVANRVTVPGALPLGNFYLGGNETNNPLPVELDNFVATTIKNEVILDWYTGHEQNNNGFDVERASLGPKQNRSDADINFQKIGFVPSKGNSNLVQGYIFKDGNLESGRFAYRLKQIDHNGNHTYYLLNNEVIVTNPNKFFISQNYPNPFNPSTTINYEMPFDGTIKLVVFDNLGREIKTLTNGNVNAGYYKAEFNASSLPSGIYFYKVNAVSGSERFEKVFKMMLIK